MIRFSLIQSQKTSCFMIFYDSKLLIPIPLVDELPVTLDFYEFNYTPKIK